MSDTQSTLSELFKGMAKFREQLKQPELNGDNPYFKNKYVTLSGVQKSIDEALKDTGLAYMQLVSNDPSGNVGVETIITHESGQSLSSGALILVPAKKDAQSYGSSITYAKRYQLSAMFGISSDDDDDGNTAVGTPKTTAKQTNKNNQRYQKNTSTTRKSHQMTEEETLRVVYAGKLNETVGVTKLNKDEIKKMIIEKALKSYPKFEQMDKSHKLEISNICLDMIIKEFGGNSK